MIADTIIEEINKITDVYKSGYIMTGIGIEKLKQENKELKERNEILERENKLMKKQLNHFGSIFDDFDKNKKLSKEVNQEIRQERGNEIDWHEEELIEKNGR